jgi:hypothetical protein
MLIAISELGSALKVKDGLQWSLLRSAWDAYRASEAAGGADFQLGYDRRTSSVIFSLPNFGSGRLQDQQQFYRHES